LKLPKTNQLPNTTIGYHGTRQVDAEEIMRTNFKPSVIGSGAYLGEGVYFFDNQLSHAKRWAKNEAGQRQRGTVVAVIESEIKYGNLMNLTDPEALEMVKTFKNAYERKANTRVTLATIIDIAADLTKTEVVKACRYPGNTELMWQGFTADVELILAVRAIGNILSKRLVWSEMLGY
jgi:Poly(ADP-ribose) polymerase catalytic domain